MFQTLNEGSNWTRLPLSMDCVFDLAVSNEGVLYAAGVDQGMAKIVSSSDRGKNWVDLLEDKRGDTFEAITLVPHHPEWIIAGLVQWNEKAGGKIMMTKDHGKTWIDITSNLPESMGPAAMAIHPKNNSLYALLYAGCVYKRSLEI